MCYVKQVSVTTLFPSIFGSAQSSSSERNPLPTLGRRCTHLFQCSQVLAQQNWHCWLQNVLGFFLTPTVIILVLTPGLILDGHQRRKLLPKSPFIEALVFLPEDFLLRWLLVLGEFLLALDQLINHGWGDLEFFAILVVWSLTCFALSYH